MTTAPVFSAHNPIKLFQHATAAICRSTRTAGQTRLDDCAKELPECTILTLPLTFGGYIRDLCYLVSFRRPQSSLRNRLCADLEWVFRQESVVGTCSTNDSTVNVGLTFTARDL